MSFDKKCMRLGVITMLCALVANFLPVTYLYVTTGVVPTAGELGQILAMVSASFLIGWILQPITFYPALGVGGSFLAWTTGNVSDLRMSAVAAAQKSAETEGGTEAGNVISTMAVAVSNLLTVVLLTVFVILGSTVISALPASVTSTFSYLVPAIFGALICDYLMKNIKYNAPLVISGVIVYIILKALSLASTWITLLVVIIGFFVSRVVFVLDNKKTKTEA